MKKTKARSVPRDSVRKVGRPYSPPQLIELGHLADVVQKSGTPPDMSQVSKPGGGGG